MIRLWNRVGVFRLLSVAALGIGLIGGLTLAQRESGEDTTSTEALAAAEVEQSAKIAEDLAELEQELADRKNAQIKADALVGVDASQAGAVNQQASRNAAAAVAASKSAAAAKSSSLAISSSCSSYSGNRAVGCTLLVKAGYSIDQMSCLDKLWTKESNWSVTAENSSSGAYGIPQALPGSKMAVFGSDWRTSASTQISWGLNYIDERYSTPCSAWSHSQSSGWY